MQLVHIKTLHHDIGPVRYLKFPLKHANLLSKPARQSAI